MFTGTILIIDDENNLRGLIVRMLELEDYKVHQAADAKTGFQILESEHIDVVLCDVKLPDANGVDLVSRIKEQYPILEILLLTAYGTIPDGVKAIKSGAFDYITKGEGNEQILPVVNRAMEKSLLQKRLYHLEKQVTQRYGFEQIIGNSKVVQENIDLAKKVAPTNTTVLLTGETGTGKEVFAQAIHYSGPRKLKPFVAVNCSAIAKDILESEMFGHKSGAFTGAMKDKKGLFEEANQGTIFLDEISELNPDLQAKLLRVLETNEFIKVGDTKTTGVDVRIIAATNKNLSDASEKGHFRPDLFYRLSVFQIVMPPLRERREDIELFTDYFIKLFAEKIKKKINGTDSAFKKLLLNYSWKGNIRELRNVIERVVILSDSETLTAELLPYEIRHISKEEQMETYDLEHVEKRHIQKILQVTNGNKTEAARLLNIGLTTLYRKIQEFNL